MPISQFSLHTMCTHLSPFGCKILRDQPLWHEGIDYILCVSYICSFPPRCRDRHLSTSHVGYCTVVDPRNHVIGSMLFYVGSTQALKGNFESWCMSSERVLGDFSMKFTIVNTNIISENQRNFHSAILLFLELCLSM